MDKPLSDMRREYVGDALLEDAVDPDPIRQFDIWFDEAIKRGLIDANAMTLATVGPDRRPSARIVLLKGFDQRGFVFYTDYRSRKGLDLAQNPYAALCLYWPPFERQVRIEGGVTKTSEQESDDYFASRPRESQLAAAASHQSAVLPDRATPEA
ncbi:MAG: pyridoxamine 5'-phosphate oxidase, partial [Planctomycetota bacterium]